MRREPVGRRVYGLNMAPIALDLSNRPLLPIDRRCVPEDHSQTDEQQNANDPHRQQTPALATGRLFNFETGRRGRRHAVALTRSNGGSRYLFTAYFFSASSLISIPSPGPVGTSIIPCFSSNRFVTISSRNGF